ncbi:low specificity L-threonine aldolase [Chitinimonas sp. BJYL2]|uniref:threonine aldolase family protein n=1 Tax=Chitinimonas sp. BJYL2 TaxID=2976696 RepID=UPI0022B36E22|nr:beta-eliminating lyase-related protein [Chitinimonas sp. BJYL2]
MNPLELRQQCHTVFPGHRAPSPAEQFAAMGAWCEANAARGDYYGEGKVVQDFERKVADLLGYPAALFVISGTMAQTVALRLACEDRGSSLVAMHPTAHIALHERSNYQLLNHFKLLTLGDKHRCWTASHLAAVPDRLGAALYELPMREIGGQLPDWAALDEIKTACRVRNIHLHLDGARLWEAAAGYGKPLAAVCAGFDSAYVSFYKGIGGQGGAMLLGSEDFIARARVWMARMGGNVWQRLPYVVSAAMQFDARLAQLPACVQRARELALVLGAMDGVAVNPPVPQVNMFHLHLPFSEATVVAARNRLAQEDGIWLFGGAQAADKLEHAYVEWYVGDQLLAASDAQVRDAMACFLDYCRA